MYPLHLRINVPSNLPFTWFVFKYTKTLRVSTKLNHGDCNSMGIYVISKENKNWRVVMAIKPLWRTAVIDVANSPLDRPQGNRYIPLWHNIYITIFYTQTGSIVFKCLVIFPSKFIQSFKWIWFMLKLYQ